MAHELGDFLRARRADAALEPPPARTTRRRVTGLRREEVAAASGVSIDYYIRLEQGRETNPSDAVLDALARTLRLTADATEHLYRLRNRGPSALIAERRVDDALRDRMTALVEAVSPHPAYVLDRLSYMVAANTEGVTLYDGFDGIPPAQRNTCRYLVNDPRARTTFVEWEELAHGAVAHLRAANADDLQDPELQVLVGELSATSPQFEAWWSGHIVERRRTSIKHLRTQAGDVVARRHEVLYLPEDGLRMTLWLDSKQR